MIDFYTAPTPNGRKVSCTLEAMKLKYETHVVNLMENEQKKPEFLAISPRMDGKSDHIYLNWDCERWPVIHPNMDQNMVNYWYHIGNNRFLKHFFEVPSANYHNLGISLVWMPPKKVFSLNFVKQNVFFLVLWRVYHQDNEHKTNYLSKFWKNHLNFDK